MSFATKPKVLSYTEAARILSDQNVQNDVEDACRTFSKMLLSILDKFETISKMVHSIDMLGLTVPLRPKWDALRRDFSELLWQFRTAAGNISGRLKMFSTTILPMVVTCDEEVVQVLQSFMMISGDHANLIRSVVERSMRLSVVLASFHTEFAKFTSIRTEIGQKELRELSGRIHELDVVMRELSTSNGRLSNPDPTHLVYTLMRVGSSAGGKPMRSKLSHRKLALTGSMAPVGAAYDSFDQKRNEVAHALYSAELCFGKRDKFSNTQISLSTLAIDEITTMECGLNLFLAVWARLVADSTEIYQWLKNPSNQAPTVVVDYAGAGISLYSTLSLALDACVSGIDPSRFTKT